MSDSHTQEPSAVAECDTCADDPRHAVYPIGECKASERRCGHHCNCSWVHDCCHWCGTEFGGDGEECTPLGWLDRNGERYFVFDAGEMWDIYDEAPFLFTTTWHPLCNKVPPRPA